MIMAANLDLLVQKVQIRYLGKPGKLGSYIDSWFDDSHVDHSDSGHVDGYFLTDNTDARLPNTRALVVGYIDSWFDDSHVDHSDSGHVDGYFLTDNTDAKLPGTPQMPYSLGVLEGLGDFYKL